MNKLEENIIFKRPNITLAFQLDVMGHIRVVAVVVHHRPYVGGQHHNSKGPNDGKGSPITSRRS